MDNPEGWNWETAIRNLEDVSPELALELQGTFDMEERMRWISQRNIMGLCEDAAADFVFVARVIDTLMPERCPKEEVG